MSNPPRAYVALPLPPKSPRLPSGLQGPVALLHAMVPRRLLSQKGGFCWVPQQGGPRYLVTLTWSPKPEGWATVIGLLWGFRPQLEPTRRYRLKRQLSEGHHPGGVQPSPALSLKPTQFPGLGHQPKLCRWRSTNRQSLFSPGMLCWRAGKFQFCACCLCTATRAGCDIRTAYPSFVFNSLS